MFLKNLSIIFLMLIFLEGCYLAKNAFYLGTMLSSRRSLKEIQEDKNTDEKIRKKIDLVFEILEFAKKQGLKTKGIYEEYVDIKGEAVSFIVEAAEVDQLKQITWWFPIVGDVPYLAYFEKKGRDEKSQELQKAGYDIYLSEAEAFSGLGWIRDPIFSTYLKKSVFSLSNLLFHELTHTSFWISGSVEFNETLASYVADVLTTKFLESKSNSQELSLFLLVKADQELFVSWLHELKAQLEALYSQRAQIPREQLLVKKKEIFSLYLSKKRPNFKKSNWLGDETWNNATVLANSMYVSQSKRFARAHACVGDITMGQFLRILEEANQKIKDPFQSLDSLCSKKGGGRD